MRPLRAALCLIAIPALSGCFGYRLMRPEEIPIPSYEPRPVEVPEECEVLIRRAAESGMRSMTEMDARAVLFCQQQQIIRAQEEEIVLRRVEAHAQAASFGLRVVTVVLGATFAVLTWLF